MTVPARVSFLMLAVRDLPHIAALSPGAFKGFTLAINLEGPDEVDAAYEALQSIEGVMLRREPEDLSFGGAASRSRTRRRTSGTWSGPREPRSTNAVG